MPSLSFFSRSLLLGLWPLAVLAAPPADNPLLVDTRWHLQALDGTPVAAGQGGEPLSLQLQSGSQKLSGFAGCNRLQGRYTQRGTQLALTALGTTRMACPQPVQQQEQRFIELLGAVDGYRIEGRVMSLLQGETVRLSFKAVPAR